MKPMSAFQLARLNLLRRPLSTLISGLSIAVAVAASGVLLKVSLLAQSRFQTLALEGTSVVGAKAGGLEILLGSLGLEGEWPDYLPYNLFRSIQSQQEVRFEDGGVSKPSRIRAVIPFLHFATYDSYRVIGTSAEFVKRPLSQDSPEIAEGQWSASRGETLVGAEVARQNDIHPGSMLRAHAKEHSGEHSGERSEPTTSQAIELRVSAVLKPTGHAWDYAVFTSIEEAQESLAKAGIGARSIWGANVLSYFLIYHDPAEYPQLESLINRRTVGQIIKIDSEVEHLQKLTGTGQSMGFLLTCLILFLSGTSVAAMMVARFDAIAVQLAVLRAIGWSKSEISRAVFSEGAIMGAAAVFVGAILDIAIFPVVRSVSGLDLPPYISTPYLQTSIVWIAAIIATVAAVIIPMFRLYRQDVNASLKG